MRLTSRSLLATILAALPAIGLAAGPTTGNRPESAPAVATTRPIAPPSEAQIREAIRDLNNPSPRKRREAVRQLATWGPLAFEALGRVAAGADLEPALLARDLLAEMGEVLFVGGRVRLEAEPTRIRWNEPVTLTVHVDNPTPGQVVVPWPGGDESTAASPGPLDDARQVSALMDIADQLSVTGPAGEEVEIRVDPIEQDTAVYRAVAIRAGDNPPAHAIPAGTSERLTIPFFNRGWARYALLGRGTYTLRFAYQPQWKDPTWVAQGFGRIESNPVTIEVTEPAPAEILQAQRPIRLDLRRDGGKLLGELQNTWDRDLWLNLNLNGPLDSHARLEWCPQPGDDGETDPFQLETDATGPQFAADHVKLMAPGEKVVLSNVEASVIRKHIQARGNGNTPESPTIALKYTQVPTAQDIRRALREKGRRDNIPGQLFSGSATSDPIRLAD